MMYGDRDYQCNCEWIFCDMQPKLTVLQGGGERISLAIKSSITAQFQKARYADILTNATNSGGSVRQYGSLSFSRIYGAGHESEIEDLRAFVDFLTDHRSAGWYQPETAFQIFNRVMSDVGLVPTTGVSTYSTTGPASVFDIKNEMPKHPPAECYFWDIMGTCTPTQARQFNNGTAIMKDFIMIEYISSNGIAIYY